LYLLGCPASLSENWRITSMTHYSSLAGFHMSGALFALVFISDTILFRCAIIAEVGG